MRDEESSDDGLLESDGTNSDNNGDGASSEVGWSGDNEHGTRAGGSSTAAFTLHPSTLNVRWCSNEKTKAPATATRHRADVLAITETRSRSQVQVQGEGHGLWEWGAERVEDKALLVHMGDHFSATPKVVTGDVFVSTVQYRGKDMVHVGVVYTTPHKPKQEVLDGLQDLIHSFPAALLLLGNLNKDTMHRRAYQESLKIWGYSAYPSKWTWTRRGAGVHAHERSMVDFIMVPQDIQVSWVQVLGHIPVRTNHRMVVVEVR